MRGTLICKHLGCKRVSSQEEGHHPGRKHQSLLLLTFHLVCLLVRPPLKGMSCIWLLCALLHHCCHSPFDPLLHCRFAIAVYHACIKYARMQCALQWRAQHSALWAVLCIHWDVVCCAGTSGCCRTCKHALRVIDGCWPIDVCNNARFRSFYLYFMDWEESWLYVLLLFCAFAPVFALIVLGLVLLEFSKCRC